jgi:hypothetical protein
MGRLLCLVGLHNRVSLDCCKWFVCHHYACRRCHSLWYSLTAGGINAWVRDS